MIESHDAAAIASGIPRDAAPPEVGPRVLGRLHDRPLDLLVRDEALDLTRGDQPVVQPLVTTHVVVLQVDQPQLGVRPLESVPLAVAVEQPVLGDPVELARELHRVVLEPGQHRLPPFEHLEVVRRGVLLLDVLPRALEVLPLHLHRREPAAVGQADERRAREVPGHVVERRHRRRQREVGDVAVLDQLEDERRRPELQQRRDLAQVRVADDHVQPAVLLGVGVRLVARVDDRALQRGLQTDLGLEEVRALRDLVAVPRPLVPRRLAAQLAGAAEDLPGDEERREPRDQVRRTAPAGRPGSSRASRTSCPCRRCCSCRPRAAARRASCGWISSRDRSSTRSPALSWTTRSRGVSALGRRVLGVRVVDVVAGAVGQDHVRETQVLLGRLPQLDGLEPASVAERRLLLVVPADPPERARVGADQQRGGDDRVELGRRRPRRSRTRSRCR